MASNGLRVPEPRSGWAEGVSPKLGTLLLRVLYIFVRK